MHAGIKSACVHDGSSQERLYILFCHDVLCNDAVLTQAWQIVDKLSSAAKPGFGSFHVHNKQTEQNISDTCGLILFKIWLCKADRPVYRHDVLAGSSRACL